MNAFETTKSTVQKDNKVIVHHCKLETKICSSFAQKLEVPNPHNSNDLEVLQNRSREACWNSTFYDVGSEIRVTAWDSYNTCRKWDNRYMQWYKLYIPVNKCKLSEPSTVSECLLFCNLQLQPHLGTTVQWISGLPDENMLGIQVDHDQRIILESSQKSQGGTSKLKQPNEWKGLRMKIVKKVGCLMNQPTFNHLFHVMFHHPIIQQLRPDGSPHSALGRLDGSATRDFTKASTTRRWRSLQLYRLHFSDVRENVGFDADSWLLLNPFLGKKWGNLSKRHKISKRFGVLTWSGVRRDPPHQIWQGRIIRPMCSCVSACDIDVELVAPWKCDSVLLGRDLQKRGFLSQVSVPLWRFQVFPL